MNIDIAGHVRDTTQHKAKEDLNMIEIRERTYSYH